MSSVENNVTIKKRLTNLKQQIQSIRCQNSQNKGILSQCQKQIKLLQKKLQDPFKVVNDYFVIARQSLKANYEKECGLYEQQTDFLQDQIEAMINDKIKAHQNILLVEEKLKTLAEDVGM